MSVLEGSISPTCSSCVRLACPHAHDLHLPPPAIQASNTDIPLSTQQQLAVMLSTVCMEVRNRAGPYTDSRMQTHMHTAMRGRLDAQWVSSETECQIWWYLDTALTASGVAVH